MKTVLALASALAVWGCDLLGPCDAYEASGIGVELVDSTTQARVVSDTVWGRVTDGTYVDSMRVSNIGRPEPIALLFFAHEREGVYDVAVGATGYQDWERRGVRVRGGRCHVKSVGLTAKLQPIS